MLRGLVQDWPVVRAARESDAAIGAYLKRFDRRRRVDLISAGKDDGLLFYEPGMQRLNFETKTTELSPGVDEILAHAADPAAPPLYIQSLPVPEAMPAFAEENRLSIVDPRIPARIWIGNGVNIAAHFDLSYNIACVVAGRRRVTLFPPDQLANLYIGPIDFTPAGTPVSMASLDQPDFDRHPRFREALKTALRAELAPGDAVYIPYFWWHSIKSLAPFNVLVNYWWNTVRPWVNSPYDSLLHAVLALRDAPPDQRAAWRAMFDYFVFQPEGEALAHLAPEHRGALGPLTPERARQLRMMLARTLAG